MARKIGHPMIKNITFTPAAVQPMHAPSDDTINNLRSAYLCLGSAKQTLNPADQFYEKISDEQRRVESLVTDAKRLRDNK